MLRRITGAGGYCDEYMYADARCAGDGRHGAAKILMVAGPQVQLLAAGGQASEGFKEESINQSIMNQRGRHGAGAESCSVTTAHPAAPFCNHNNNESVVKAVCK
jgi:hypothetical protein